MSFAVVTTKENKTVYGDIEILNGFSYAIRLLGYYLMFSLGRLVSRNPLLSAGMSAG